MLTNENAPRCEANCPSAPHPPDPSLRLKNEWRGAGIGRGWRARRHKDCAGGRAPSPGPARKRRPGHAAANERLPGPRGSAGQQPSRPRALRGLGTAPPSHRELFLLLGSTPLKVVVVVMAPWSEVGWRGRRELTGTGLRGAAQLHTEKTATAAGASATASRPDRCLYRVHKTRPCTAGTGRFKRLFHSYWFPRVPSIVSPHDGLRQPLLSLTPPPSWLG